MGFRDYNPAINRFTVRDTYNGALNDLNLTTNLWTGNRYTMAGGNPITGIEQDGHCAADDGILIGCATLQGEARRAREQQLAQQADPPRAPVDRRIGHTQVHAEDWDIYTAAYLEALRRFHDRRDGANADHLTMLRDCMDANEFCMGSGWLDVHEFLDYLCAHPGMVCPGEGVSDKVCKPWP